MESPSVLFDCKTTGKSTRCAQKSGPRRFARRARRTRRETDWIQNQPMLFVQKWIANGSLAGLRSVGQKHPPARLCCWSGFRSRHARVLRLCAAVIGSEALPARRRRRAGSHGSHSADPRCCHRWRHRRVRNPPRRVARVSSLAPPRDRIRSTTLPPFPRPSADRPTMTRTCTWTSGTRCRGRQRPTTRPRRVRISSPSRPYGSSPSSTPRTPRRRTPRT